MTITATSINGIIIHLSDERWQHIIQCADMALANYQEAQTYLKFLPLLHGLPKQPFLIVYDTEADVLYIDFKTHLNLLATAN